MQQSETTCWEVCEASAQHIIDRVARLPHPYARAAQAQVGDARKPLLRQYDLIVTSPPYGAAQKYARSSSLALGWLGWSDLNGTSSLERATIGREHVRQAELQVWPSGIPSVRARGLLAELHERSPVRAAIYARYFADMNACLGQAYAALRPGGALALICAPNTAAGLQVPTHEVLRDFVEQLGLRLEFSGTDTIRARQLQARRSNQPVIREEYLFVFRRAHHV